MTSKHDTSVYLICSSDVHGHWSAHGDVSSGAMSKVASYVEIQREQQQHVCFFDNGDVLQGTPLSSYLAKQGTEGAKSTAALLASIGLDFAVPGNHDFDYGIPFLQDVIRHSTFPWLIANVTEQSGRPLADSSIILTFGTVRIGFIGVTTRISKWQYPDRMSAVNFDDEVEAVQSHVIALRDLENPPDAIVVCYHGGLEDTGAHQSKLAENQAMRIATEISGIDVIITGHQHGRWVKTINNTVIIQPGAYGKHVGEIKLTFANGKKVKPTIISRIVDVTDYEEHARFMQVLSPIQNRADEILDSPLSFIEHNISVNHWKEIVRSEHLLVEWMHQVQMKTTSADLSAVAYVDSFFHPFQRPHITARDLDTFFPYSDQLKVFKISGKVLREALEVTASWYKDGSLEPNNQWTVPHLQLYKYIMFDGIKYEIDIRRKLGERITYLKYEDRPVRDIDVFRIAMTGFLAEQIERYPMFAELELVCVVPGYFVDHLQADVRKRDISQIKYDPNWAVVGSDVI